MSEDIKRYGIDTLCGGCGQRGGGWSLSEMKYGPVVKFSDHEAYVQAKVAEERKRCLKINLNNQVLIRLRELGRNVFEKHFADLHLNAENYYRIYEQPDGRLKMMIWEVAHMFGPRCFMGADIPIETEIEIVPDVTLAAVEKLKERLP